MSAILQRLQALLQQTKSPYEEERRTAAVKACELILKHELIILEPAPDVGARPEAAKKEKPPERTPADLSRMRKQFEDILGRDHPEILAAKRKGK
jgi:hypothetical protein